MLRGTGHGEGHSGRDAWCQAGTTIGSARVVASVAVLLLLSSGHCQEVASAVCGAQCQAQQAAALFRVQAALLGPGQDPSLLMLPPGVAAYGPTGAGIVGGGPGEGPPVLPSSSGLATHRGPPPDWPADLPAHCRVPGTNHRWAVPT